MDKATMLRELADELERPHKDIKLPSGDITVQEAMRRMRAAWPGQSVHVGMDAWDYSHSGSKVEWTAYVSISEVNNTYGTTLREAVEGSERKSAERAAQAAQDAMPGAEKFAGADEVIIGSTDTAIIEVAATDRTPPDVILEHALGGES